MTNKTTSKRIRQRNTQTSVPTNAEIPLHIELAAEAVLEGWTHEQVIDMLVSRISRDRRYLAYRKACNRRTSYDDQVQQDMRALALATCWLTELSASEAPQQRSAPITAQTPRAARSRPARRSGQTVSAVDR